jgi:hypothetical protein
MWVDLRGVLLHCFCSDWWRYKIEEAAFYLYAPPRLYRRSMLGQAIAVAPDDIPTWIGFIAVGRHKPKCESSSGGLKIPEGGKGSAKEVQGVKTAKTAAGPSSTDAEALLDIAVVFRGTSMDSEWFWNLSAGQADPM